MLENYQLHEGALPLKPRPAPGPRWAPPPTPIGLCYRAGHVYLFSSFASPSGNNVVSALGWSLMSAV